MSDTGGDYEGQKPKGIFSTLMADGDWLFIKGEYKKAVESFTKVSQPLKYHMARRPNKQKLVML